MDLKQATREQIERDFTYQAPKPDQVPRYEHIRDQARQFAGELVEACPTSPELTIALERVSEAVMWANAAIARHE